MFPFLQAIYQRITKISRFLTPPKYKNQPICSQAERHVERQVLTIVFNLPTFAAA